LLAFAAVLAVAFVVYVLAGRKYWFYLDEWDFLSGRDGGNLGDLFRPHNEHWTTLPILAYRVLWNVFGLNSYRPYQFLLLGLHLTAAVLLRVIMRRSGVSPWIATGPAFRDITVSWIRHALERGRIPDTASSPDDAATATVILALRQTGDPEPTGPCKPFEARTSRLEAGEWIDFRGTVLVRLLGDDGGNSAVVGYLSGGGSRLTAVAGPLVLEVAPYPDVEVVECE
jgi:hypothetical protein